MAFGAPTDPAIPLFTCPSSAFRDTVGQTRQRYSGMKLSVSLCV